jgi:carbon-monoxide dehydrogenase small subunit
MLITCTINGKKINKECDPTKRLVDFLRDDMSLKGVKEGCSEGECGACTIIVNQDAVTSCTMFVGQIIDKEIITIEGLEENGEFDIIQQAFIRNGAIQCGFCSPGMILSCKALLMKNNNPSEIDIRRAIEGNLCRCTGYDKIVYAMNEVVKEVK